MTSLQAVYGTFLLLAVVVKIDQLRRRRTRERVLLLSYLLGLVIKLVASLKPVGRWLDHTFAPGTSTGLQILFEGVALYLLVLFFLAVAGDARGRRALWELVPLIVSLAAVAAMLAVADTSRRSVLFQTAGPGNWLAVMFIVISGLYPTYGFATVVLAARRYLRSERTQPQLRVALVISAIGAAGAIGWAILSQIVSVTIRAAGGQFPPGLDDVDYNIATLFTIVIFVGVSWVEPAETIARWRYRRRVLRQLHYLWSALYPHFPETTVAGPPPPPGRDRLVLLRTYERYDDRKTRCRDALWLLSTWMDPEHDPLPDAPAAQGPVVRRALRRYAAGEPERSDEPRSIAAPQQLSDRALTADEAVLAEDAALVELSSSLRQTDTNRGDPTSRPSTAAPSSPRQTSR